MTGLGTDVSWTRCLTKWKMFLVQARLQIDNQGSRFGRWMRLFLGNMNSVLLSAWCGWWKSGLFFWPQVPQVACWRYLAGLDLLCCQQTVLQPFLLEFRKVKLASGLSPGCLVDGLYFPSAPAAFISGLLVTEVLSLAEPFFYFCSAIWILGQAELVSWINWVKRATVPNQGINLVTSIKHDERIHGRQTVDHNVQSLFFVQTWLLSHFCVWVMSMQKMSA